MDKLKTYITLLLVFFIIFRINSQEITLTGLNENFVIKDYIKSNPNVLKSRALNDTLELPFFDDFARINVYPNNQLWLDKDVFINTSFGDNPPSIGVATFDAIDSSGSIYSNANSSSFYGDFLTSKPIKLETYTANDSLYLSFFYQPQGFAGNDPEYKDSLVLEFKDTSAVWNSIWRVPGSSNANFKQVLIPITDAKYLYNGFQFRFLNYASLGDPLELSWHSNCDIWNLDYVYLNNNRTNTDTVYDDVSIVYPVESPLNHYNAMPWKHFKQNSFEMTNSMTIIVKNLYDELLPFVSLYKIANLTENDLGIEQQYGSDNVDVNSTFTMSKTGFTFDSTPSDSALFEIKTYLQADSSDVFTYFHWNDTACFYQKFYNYYAYDDETPEYGLGLYGIGSEDGMMAMKYYTYFPDTLRALQIFFNHTKEEANLRYFYMNVWDSENGHPGNLIYSQIGVQAEYNGLNQFTNYLFDTLLIVSDTFFIGWQKTHSIEMMNVGFDLSVDNKDKLYYSFNGSQWYGSPYYGTAMIRPVFGKDISSVDVPIINSNNFNIEVYPNPSSDYIYINTSKLHNVKNYKIAIYNIIGNIIYESDNLTDKIDVSQFESGMYFINFSNHSNNLAQGKFIVTH